jgi:RimJ/RimL family protein N-acetyltransferase
MPHVPRVPRELRTERLLLRCWRVDDAASLLSALQSSGEHLRWIPPHVAAPAPIPELAQRLRGFAADFVADDAWRFGIFAPAAAAPDAAAPDAATANAATPGATVVFGEAALFPRAAHGRTTFALADRVEIGYWLRPDATGRGYATEAARALVDLAARLPHVSHVEIRCDPLNTASAAVPARLGFHRAATEEAAEPGLMIWTSRADIQHAEPPAGTRVLEDFGVGSREP